MAGGGAGGRGESGEEMRAKWDYRLPSYEIFPPQITYLSNKNRSSDYFTIKDSHFCGG